MRLKPSLVMLLFLFSSVPLWAKEYREQLHEQNFLFSADESWRIEKNALGMALSLWGKVNERGVRPVISVAAISLEMGLPLFSQPTEQLISFYQHDRRPWFEKRKATDVTFLEPIKKDKRIELGVRYTLGGHTKEVIEERSLYLSCSKAVLHIKLLEREKLSEEGLKLLRSFKCF